MDWNAKVESQETPGVTGKFGPVPGASVRSSACGKGHEKGGSA